MIEAAKSKQAEDRAVARQVAEATLRRISEQGANGFYSDLP